MNSQDPKNTRTPLIEDVVSASSSAEFRNDVQLAQYRSEHNLDLAKDFIFTRNAAAGRKSSVALLKHMCEAYMPGAPPNRFVFIATYGHGKSHLAVATANYFGKALDTPELEGVLASIKHAVQDVPLYGFFEAFKRNNKPFLILILRGDEPSDLQTKFFRAVEDALRFDSKSGEIRAPFWYADAERFVQAIRSDTDERRESANEFLNRYQLDLDLLLERITAQEASTYELTRELCVHLNCFAPDFGTGLSLKEGVEWLGKNLVGDGKPYGGVLILFDEFSSFVWDYALRIRHRPGAPLQDLLNGVDSMRGKVAFVAFAQRDPELVAKSLLSGDSLQSLITQLNRLPKLQHYQLHSSLEEVLDAYLKQNRDAWKTLLANSHFTSAIGQANDLCFDIFSTRYLEILEWDVEQFQEVVTEGCFPLHPATTALLSSVELETTSNPRSVLGFVVKHLDLMRGAGACDADEPTWVLPIALADYFKEMLGQKNWGDFSDAVAQAGGPDAPPDQIAVLKAMLLQTAGKVATKGAYSRVIAHFAGLSLERATKGLQALAESGVIRYDPPNKLCTFWPAGKGPNKVDQVLSENLRGRVLDGVTIDAVMKPLRAEGLFNNISVPIPWGHQDDWQAEQILASRHTFTADGFQKLAVNKIYWRADGTERSRGLVVWLIAESPEDAAWLRDSADEVVLSAFPGQNVPIIIMKPEGAEPDFARQLLRLYGLGLFTNSDIAEVGQQQYSAVWELAIESLKSGFRALEKEAEIEVPAPFKARISAIRLRDVESVLAEVFKMAYSGGPKRWFTQYKLASTRLRNATARLTAYLLSNSLDTPDIFAADNVAKEVAQQLKSEWSLLGGDLRIRQPQVTSKVRAAWDALEQSFPAGGGARPANEAVGRLLNVPYGYDFNTLSLVFASWFGFHRHDLEVSLNGQLRSLKSVTKDLKPREFVGAVASVSIKRTDADAVRNRVLQLLEKVDRGSFSKSEAQEALQILTEAMERDDVDRKPAVEAASNKIRRALESAEKYDKSVGDLERLIDSHKNLLDLAKTFTRLATIQMPETVKPERPAPGELRDRLLERIRNLTDQLCGQYRQLKSISDFRLNEQQLRIIRRTLVEIQLPDLVALVDSALKALEEAKGDLERKQRDETYLAVLKSIEPRGGLKRLNELIASIEGMTFSAEATKQFAADKLQALRKEVERLERFKAGVADRLAGVCDAMSLEAVRTDILQKLNLFDGPEGANELQESLEQCKELREFFDAVEVRRRGVVRTPADAREVIERLTSLFRECESRLSRAQQSIVSSALAEIESQVGKQSEAAVRWLGECEKALEDGEDLDELAAKVKTPPIFLQEEGRPRLEAVAQEVKQRVENRRQQAATAAALKSIGVKGNLVELHNQIAMIEALSVPTAALRHLAQEKLAAIRLEVRRLQDFKAGVVERVAGVCDVISLEGVWTDILRKLNLFDGSDGANELQESLAQCKQLREFFDAVEVCRRGVVRTPADAREVIEQLTSLSRECEFRLSRAQQSIASSALAEIEGQVGKHSEAAVRWLGECEKTLEDGEDLDELAAKVKAPPVFLPEEERPRLESVDQEVRQRVESRRQEAATAATLRSVAVKGNLVELHNQIAMIEALSVPTAALQQLAQGKLAAIRLEVKRLKDFTAGIAERVADARDVRSLENVEPDILRHLNLFDGTDEAFALQRSLEHCKELREVLNSVERYRRSVVRTPADARELVDHLFSLSREYGSRLSAVQETVVSNARAEIAEQVAKESEAAAKWLGDCEKALGDGQDLDELAQRLKSPPPFLPEHSQCHLVELAKETSRRIDDDQVLRVVAHFKAITDAAKRSECLDRLKALLEEE